MIAFHTPQPPAPLNLDLARLDGDGACPAQFYGETHDGRAVYCRYRGGVLRIEIAPEPGVETDWLRDTVLEKEIGPYLHGSMSLRQMCELAGVTVQGALPSARPHDQDETSDLTGATTYFSVSLRLSAETAAALLNQIMALRPDGRLVELAYDLSEDRAHRANCIDDATRLRQAQFQLVFGAPDLQGQVSWDSQSGKLALPKGALSLGGGFTLVQYPGPRYARTLTEVAEKKLGKSFAVAGQDGGAYDTFSLNAAFATGDTDHTAILNQVAGVCQAACPDTPLLAFDLSDGTRLPRLDRSEPLDPILVAWCRNGPNRWRSIQHDREADIWVGHRPSAASPDFS